MNTKHKIILIIFGVIDIVIVALLGWTIYSTWSSYTSPLFQSQVSGCAKLYIDTFQKDGAQVTYSNSDGTISLNLVIPYMETQSLDESILLWSILDQLGSVSENSSKLCENPERILLTLYITTDQDIQKYLIMVPVADLIAWSRNEISEDVFVKTIKYSPISPSAK